VRVLSRFPSPSLLVHRATRVVKARHRLLRRKFRAARHRAVLRTRLALLKLRNQAHLKGRSLLTFASKWIATATGLLLAGLFALTLPEAMVTNATLKVSEVHLASAGIIGTALALVLSLSIVPAQKAADVFSSAILRLYARDRTTLGVFALLSCAALASLLLGTGWTFSLSARYSLAGQLILLGASLDALRAFYSRALALLDPATALGLVREECSRYVQRTSASIERLVRIYRLTAEAEGSAEAFRYTCYSKSQLSAALNGWTTQLEEFARKAVARRDTQAVNAIVRTMAEIGNIYAEARRDSMLLLPDWSGGMPIGVSDIGNVLSPIYENIKAISEDAAKHPNEAVVQGCMATLGDMAAHAMTVVHTADHQKTAPLAFSPVFYIDLCVKAAIAAGMENALLAAVTATRKVFSGILKDVDTQAAEEQALGVLFSIAIASYPRQAMVSSFKSVEMMMLAALHDIRVRGYRDIGSLLRTVLPNIAALMPFEAVMDKAGQRRMQPFPPYSLGFEANLPTLLAEVARQVKPVDPKRSWIDPFHDFSEASEAVVHHYREVAEKVAFGGTLLQKWVVDSLLNAAEVHIHALDNPPTGAEPFTDTLDERLHWFLHAPAFFFREQTEFPFHHANEACDGLAVLGMALLRRERLESAGACGDAIRSIALKSAKAESPRSYSSAYGFADCIVKLELLARAADALGWPAVAVAFRARSARPEGIADDRWPEYAEAVARRTRQMDEELKQRDRGYRIRPEPVAELRDILRQDCGTRTG
jgi:hypothetical protein